MHYRMVPPASGKAGMASGRSDRARGGKGKQVGRESHGQFSHGDLPQGLLVKLA